MAGDWIKLDNCTPSKPEVLSMAEFLGVSENEVLGGLARLWIWADQNSIDGNDLGVTQPSIDRITCVSHMYDALMNVGWIEDLNGVQNIPNFDRHNGQTAKARALTAKRQARFKAKYKTEYTNAPVTMHTLPREDKSREYNTVNRHSTEFVQFWTVYPKKVGKPRALDAWIKIKPNNELLKQILSSIEIAKKSNQWQRDSGQYIPNPSTWLNNEGWSDSYEYENVRSSGSGNVPDRFAEARKRANEKRVREHGVLPKTSEPQHIQKQNTSKAGA